jgi:hypothetical protein
MLALLLAAVGCSTAADISAPNTRSTYAVGSPDSVIAPRATHRLLLEWASRGLLYTSESDYPFVYFRHAGISRSTRAALSIGEFRALLGISPSTAVEVISLDDFFARHIERVDPADDVARALVPRYVLLRETLRATLSHVVVYRVGAIAIDCYAVGFDARGDLEGLTTISIET